MQWVRRHRQRILLFFSLAAVAAMTWGYLKRVGLDPLPAPDGPEATPSVQPDCEPVEFDGLCELRSVTPLLGSSPTIRRLRAVYSLQGGPSGARVSRTELVNAARVDEAAEQLEAATPIRCRGVWMAGACESPPFVFGTDASNDP